MYWSGSDLHIEEIAVQNEQKIVSDIWTHSTGKSSQFWARKKLVSSETSEIGHVLVCADIVFHNVMLELISFICNKLVIHYAVF